MATATPSSLQSGRSEAVLKRFSEIATQAALVAKGDTVGAKQLLLEHLQAVPFEMNCGRRTGAKR